MIWLITVGIAGATVSMTSSLVVKSVDELPAVSVTVAVTGYVPSGRAEPAGICKVQAVPVSVRFPSPEEYVFPLTDTVSSSPEPTVAVP